MSLKSKITKLFLAKISNNIFNENMIAALEEGQEQQYIDFGTNTADIVNNI